MKQATRQKFPPGWNERKVLAVIAHYDQQTDDEGAAEIETAPEAPGETWMSVPIELVGAVANLIEENAKKRASVPSRNHKKKARPGKARK